MPEYCAYSYQDLFQAATGRAPTETENAELASLTQPERNARVKELATQASWRTKEVKSYEGEIFLAFWPKTRARIVKNR